MLEIGTKIGTKIGTLSKLQVRNLRTGNVIRKTSNNDQHIKVQKKETYICAKNVIHVLYMN